MQDGELILTARRGNEAVIGGRQHYQLEHYLLHQSDVTKAAVLARNSGFDIIFEGTAAPDAIRRQLAAIVDPKYLANIRPARALPVDKRHRSKVLYHKIKP